VGRIVQRDEEEHAAVDREGRRPQLIRKRDEYLRQMERGVNIPRLNRCGRSGRDWKISSSTKLTRS
jgi:hypothetical protein